MPGDPLRAKFIANNFLQDAVLVNNVRGVQGYTGNYNGKRVSVMASGMGMPSIGIYSWELMTQYDVQNLVRVGTAGSIRADIPLREVVLASGACTDSAYVNNFLPDGHYAPIASWELLRKSAEAADRMGLKVHVGNVFSTDVFYHTDSHYYEKWAAMGCMVTEMEAAALYMNAACNHRNALAMLTVSDSLVTGEATTAEERQNTFLDMMKLALETVTA
jgi:purine-nucleoside phosphorylase